MLNGAFWDSLIARASQLRGIYSSTQNYERGTIRLLNEHKSVGMTVYNTIAFNPFDIEVCGCDDRMSIP
jgi:hypothetical protein